MPGVFALRLVEAVVLTALWLPVALRRLRLFRFVKLGVEDNVARRKIHAFAVGTALGSAKFAVHAAVFPFHTQRPGIPNVIQRPDDLFKVDIAAADRLEVPETVGLVEIDMAAKDACLRRTVAPGHVLHVHMENAVVEFADETNVVDTLIPKMGRIVVEAESRVVVERLQRTLGRSNVKSNLGRVDFECVFDSELLKFIEDRLEAGGKIFETSFDLARQYRRERINKVPDAGSSEAVDYRHSETGGGLSRFDQFFSRTLPHAFRVTVAVNIIRKDRLVALVNIVANRLTDKMGGNGKTFHTSFVKGPALGVAIRLIRFGYLKVVAPAGKFDAIIAERLRFLHNGGEGHVGPLAGEECDRTGHNEGWLRVMARGGASAMARRTRQMISTARHDGNGKSAALDRLFFPVASSVAGIDRRGVNRYLNFYAVNLARVAQWPDAPMSQESYLFACPVCAARLSVPKALVGVRGPCPQCHHEITAPEPEPELSVVETIRARATTPVEAGVPGPEWNQQSPSEPVDPVSPRRSSLGVIIGTLLVLGVLVAAGSTVLPPGALQEWLGTILPSQAMERVFGRQPSVSVDGSSQDEIPAKPAPPPRIPPLGRSSNEPDAPSEEPVVPPVPEPPVADPPPVPAVIPPPPVLPPAPEPAAPESISPAPAAENTPLPTLTAPPIVETVTSPGSDIPDSPPPLVPVGPEPITSSISDAQAGAQEALTLFLHARTWQERMALSHGGEQLLNEMQEYYTTHKDGPHPPASVEFIASAPLPEGSRTVQIFHVTFDDLPQGFPVPVQETAEGWKIDWETFVEFREGRLKKFLAQYQEAPAVFRVRLQHVPPQENGALELENSHHFRIAAPIDGHEGHAYARQDDSIIGPKLADKLESNTTHYVMAKLKWVKNTNGRAYVELRDITSESWRNEP